MDITTAHRRHDGGALVAVAAAALLYAALASACQDQASGVDASSGDAHAAEPDARATGDGEGGGDAGRSWQQGDPPAGDRELQIGSGIDAWEPLMHGDELRWERGIQGGSHAWLSSRLERDVLESLTSEQRDEVQSAFRIEDEAGEVLATANRAGHYRETDEGDFALTSVFAILRAGLRPSTMDGDRLSAYVDVQLPGGETYTSSVWVHSACCD